MNMSLGIDYGESFDDDLSLAVDNASSIGMLIVAAAGNGGDKPYDRGYARRRATALSVAQTAGPERASPSRSWCNSPAAIAGAYPKAVVQSTGAPLGAGFTGDVAYVGDGCPAATSTAASPDDPYLAEPAGKVVLIDRGDCSFSLKIDRAAGGRRDRGAHRPRRPGDAVDASRIGGGDDVRPDHRSSSSRSAMAIKAQLAIPVTVDVSVSDAVSIPLVGQHGRLLGPGPILADQLDQARDRRPRRLGVGRSPAPGRARRRSAARPARRRWSPALPPCSSRGYPTRDRPRDQGRCS